MTSPLTVEHLEHDHDFHEHNPHAESRLRWVVALTLITMVLEIGVGFWTKSMALLADGWHMGTHAGALGIAVFAYVLARKHASSPRYAFGTGKVSVLGGYTSAMLLAVVAIFMIIESAQRFWKPMKILFNEALVVAVAGLVVNVISAWLLQSRSENRSGHAHDHAADGDSGHHHDHNLRAAYLHVLADAFTSVLAIIALLAGKTVGWVWMDPTMGIVGALVIARWSVGLMRDTGRILLDGDVAPESVEEVRNSIEAEAGNRLVDIHIWKVGPVEKAAILSIATPKPHPPEHYKKMLDDRSDIRHITVETHAVGNVEH